MTLTILNQILKTSAKAFSLVGLTLLISAVAFTLPAALATHQSTNPEWNSGGTANENNWFQVSNATKGTGWADTVAVSPGDLLSFQIYVHNNTCPANDASGNNQNQCPQTTATHTFVKVNLPSSGGTVTATIGSDQSATNISKNLTFTLPAGQTIAYKTNTTILRRHPFLNAWLDVTSTQDFLGANTITTTGQSLGDIAGCYSASVVVLFQAQVTNVTPPTGEVKGVKSLPKTGPEGIVSLALAGLIPAGILIRRFKV